MTERYTLKAPARLIYENLTTARKAVESAKSKYSATFGIEDEDDAKAIFAIEAQIVTEHFGPFTKPEDYILCCVSGERAAAKVLANAEIAARGKPAEDAAKIRERAKTRADLLRPFAGVLSASSRVAFHDRFLERYTVELTEAERSRADTMGFKLAVLQGRQMVPLDSHMAFAEHKDLFYRGAYVLASVNLVPYGRKTAEDKDCVTAYLGNVLWVKHGERLSAARTLDDEFGHYAGKLSDFDPTTGAAPPSGESLADMF